MAKTGNPAWWGRRFWLTMLAVLATGAVCAAVALQRYTPAHDFSKRNAMHLLRGMTEREVEQLLGAPAGDYGTGKASRVVATEPTRPLEFADIKVWQDDGWAVVIWFDAEGKVLSFRIAAIGPDSAPTWWERLRMRLRL